MKKSHYYIPSDVHILKTLGDRHQAIELRGQVYPTLFPGVDNPEKPDIYDFTSIVWSAQNVSGNMVATARLAYDDPVYGLPSERYLQQHLVSRRKKQARLAEYGRFINIEEGEAKKDLTRAFYSKLYFHACCDDVDTILIVAPQDKSTLYVNIFGAELLCEDIDEDFGSGVPFSAFAWDIRVTKPEFLIWTLGLSNLLEV